MDCLLIFWKDWKAGCAVRSSCRPCVIELIRSHRDTPMRAVGASSDSAKAFCERGREYLRKTRVAFETGIFSGPFFRFDR